LVFGDGWVVVDEVLQTGPDTLIRAHLQGETALRGPYWRPTATLTDASGSDATPSGGRWEDGPDALMEFRFAKTSGPVTFKLQGSAGLSLSEDDIAANITSQGMDEQEAATFRARMADISAASAQAGATFEGQAPAVWMLTLP
jgi:hypothetical protein